MSPCNPAYGPATYSMQDGLMLRNPRASTGGRCRLSARHAELFVRIDGSRGQEGHQLGDDLIRRLVDEPMAGPLDDDALDVVVDQAPLLYEKFSLILRAGEH